MENKVVDVYLGMHGGKNRFVHELIADDYKTFIIEWTTHQNIEELIKNFNAIKSTRAEYSKHKFAVIEKLQKQWVNIVIGDFWDESAVNHKIQSDSSADNRPNLSDLASIKTFYAQWVEVEKMRNQNYIYNIEKHQGPIGIRLGSAHGLIVQELKKKWAFDITIVTDPMVAIYHTVVVRKACLDLHIADEEYYKWAISRILSNNQELSINLHGKEYALLDQKSYNLVFAFLNALIDSYQEPLHTIGSQNYIELFTTQWFVNPLYTRIPRQQIRDFLKNYSIKKHGTPVYYEWLERQWIIY